MAKNAGFSGNEKQRDELLAKMLAVQLHSMGATQDQIARVVGKQKLWVNKLLRGVPRKAKET